MDNANLLPENEYREEDGRRYINPNLPVTETEDFITKFRDTQRGNTQEISSQTEMLGTDIPSAEGGLIGAGSYWTSRYQTPQTNAVVQNLRTAAQASALNEALQNEQAMWKKKYDDAYKNYQKRQHDAAKRASLGGGSSSGRPLVNGGTEEEDNTFIGTSYTPGVAGGYTVASIDTENGGKVLGYTGVPYGEEGKTNYHYGAGGTAGTYDYNPMSVVPLTGGRIYRDALNHYYEKDSSGQYRYLGSM